LAYSLFAATKPQRSPRLSNVIDKSLFIVSPAGVSSITLPHDSSSELDSLLASPLHVEPYQTRNIVVDPSALDAPSQRRVEGVYDRFLMATSGVKRLGKGYQSDNNGPVANTVEPPLRTLPSRVFNSTRRMPPPVSSDDQRRAVSVDELGIAQPDTPASKEGSTPSTLVRRAFKAITGKTVSRRLSRLS
jgi:serine/threonine-protein kinase GIN4